MLLAKQDFARLRSNQKFRASLLLGRAANGLRFAIRAGNEVGMQDGSVAARQRVGSYFLLSALLEELLKRVVPDVRNHLDHLKAWKAFEELVSGKDAEDLRKLGSFPDPEYGRVSRHTSAHPERIRSAQRPRLFVGSWRLLVDS